MTMHAALVCCLVLGFVAPLPAVDGTNSAAQAGQNTCTFQLTNEILGHVQSTIESTLNSGEGALTVRREVLETREQLQDTRDDLLTLKAQQLTCANDLRVTNQQLREAEADIQATQALLQNTSTALEQTRAELQATNSALQAATTPSSTFVRWGRTDCTNNSQLVYSGIVGGSWYDHSGAAASALCLTRSPEFDNKPVPSDESYIYGAEYEDMGSHRDYDVPCAVCRAAQSTTIMIPGTRSCPGGWTHQYRGHLAAGYHGHPAASDYICLDEDLQPAHPGKTNSNGYVFYYTVTVCGSLPCPPYINNRVATCVVCSQ